MRILLKILPIGIVLLALILVVCVEAGSGTEGGRWIEHIIDYNNPHHTSVTSIGAIPATALCAANGVACLGPTGVLLTAEIPSLVITNTYTANSQANMLALAAYQGDICVRTDINETFILRIDPPTVLANWTLILFPPAPVLAVTASPPLFSSGGTGPDISISIHSSLAVVANKLKVTYGTSINTSVQGNDPSVTNARTPTPHGSTKHICTGTDPTYPCILGKTTAPIPITGTCVNTAAYTLSIPGGTLGTGGTMIQVNVGLYLSTGTGNFRYGISYGGTQMYYAGNLATGPAFLTFILTGSNSVSGQVGYTFVGRGTTALSARGTAAINSANAANLTVDITVAGAGDVVTVDFVTVEVLN